MLRIIAITIFLPALFATLSQRQGKIIGGTNASLNPGYSYEFAEARPYQVAILRPTGSLYCGGSIISMWCVLTAANCEMEQKYPGFKVVSGSLSIRNYDKVTDERFVERFQPHPKYVNAGQGFDIAIIKVDRSFVFNFKVQPLVIRSFAYPPSEAIATGWGLTVSGDENSTPEILQTVTLKVLQYEECTRKWGILPASVTCASSPGKNTCHGDNGGPLVQRSSGLNGLQEFVQIGITSFRAECADTNLPGVYTNVISYLNSFILPTARAFNPM